MFTQSPDKDLIARPLFASPNATYIGRNMAEKSGIPCSFKALRNSKWILTGDNKIQFLDNGKRIEELEDLNHILVDNVETAITLVESGVGIGSLPMHLAKDNDKLIRIFPKYEQPQLHANLIYKERRYQTKATRLLIKMLLKKIENLA